MHKFAALSVMTVNLSFFLSPKNCECGTIKCRQAEELSTEPSCCVGNEFVVNSCCQLSAAPEKHLLLCPCRRQSKRRPPGGSELRVDEVSAREPDRPVYCTAHVHGYVASGSRHTVEGVQLKRLSVTHSCLLCADR